MLLTGCGRSAAFDLMAKPGFPPTSKVGRRQLARTAAVLDYLVPAEAADA